MKNKFFMTLFSLLIIGSLLSNIIYASRYDDEDRPARVSKCSSIMKKLFVGSLLFSSGIHSAVAQEVPYIEPYRELNLTKYIKQNYVEMPDSTQMTPKYQYRENYPQSGSQPYPSYGPKDNLCVVLQKKVERAYQIRKFSNQMYEDAQRPSVPLNERYSAVESAMNIELTSHILELEAVAKLQEAFSSTNSKSCALSPPDALSEEHASNS